MPGGTSPEAQRNLRGLFTLGVAGSLSDGQLLDRFVDRRGEAAEDAFAALVERHGPMVLGVCRRVLNHSQEAEDAFQATFLVLARKAATIARRETLASWLYGVALRTARDARGRASRRKAREEKVVPATHFDPARDELMSELRSILDEELARLPDRFRAALLLCELEGLSRRDASMRLGIAEGTLSSRLARAKVMLRDRLSRRGLFATTAGLTAALVKEAQAAAVPVTLAESTSRAAALSAAGCSLAGLVPASGVSLSEEVLRIMLISKIKGIVLGCVAVGAIVTGAVVAQDPPPARVDPAASGVVARASSAEDRDRLRAVETKLDRILEALGKPDGTMSSRKTQTTAEARPESSEATSLGPGVSPEVPPLASLSGSLNTAPDRLVTLERRLADVELRLAWLERQLLTASNPPPRTQGVPSTPGIPASAGTTTSAPAKP
jgi:RNA polymerase sigma factor (sigma-70 family)